MLVQSQMYSPYQKSRLYIIVRKFQMASCNNMASRWARCFRNVDALPCFMIAAVVALVVVVVVARDLVGHEAL